MTIEILARLGSNTHERGQMPFSRNETEWPPSFERRLIALFTGNADMMEKSLKVIPTKNFPNIRWQH